MDIATPGQYDGNGTFGIAPKKRIEEGDYMGFGIGENPAQDGQERIVGWIVRPEREDSARMKVARQTLQSSLSIKRTVADVKEISW